MTVTYNSKTWGRDGRGRVFGIAACLLAACTTDGSIDKNILPEANAGEDQELDYADAPVSVTLDGSGSKDLDGTIVEYIWFSGDREEGADGGGGMSRTGPDPDDRAKPVVTLEQGLWKFVLWVKDDKGAVSEPDVVEIAVGDIAEPACVPEDCDTPALGEACCTSADTGAEPGDSRGRGPDLCGTDLGAVVASLAGICLQIDQPGEETGDCPEIVGAAGAEPGCCTDEGLCASVNTSAGLGCHYPQDGPGEACTPTEPAVPDCNPEDCDAPVLGEACCTSADTGAEPGDSRGRGPGLCGTDLGAVVPDLAGICLQIDQPGEETGDCPEIAGAAGTEPGCCTDEGLCASVNTSAGLGCHYPQDGPGEACTPP